MEWKSLVTAVMVVSLVLVPAASGSAEDEMIKKAQELKVTIPQKGDAQLGTTSSMTDMLSWLNACADALMAFIHDIMNLLGIGETSYVRDMTKTLEQGKDLSKGTPK